jgi:integrase
MLIDKQVRQAKAPTDGRKQYKLYDQKGLYLEVTKTGSRRWRFRYTLAQKENTLSLGIYPDVTLKQARESARVMRNLLLEGKDPSLIRKTQAHSGEETFQGIAREWFAKFKHTWTEKHAATIMARLENHVFPYLGIRPAKDIDPPELLACLRRIESKSHLETAKRVKQICGQVFRYAVATGKASRDVSADLKGALAPPVPRNFPTIVDPVQIGALLRAIENYPGMFITRQALRLAPLVFVRPGELRRAEWSEIDIEAREWVIPAEKMKMRREHIVPLSKQACAILEETRSFSGRGRYVFPARGSNDKPMSENAVNLGLRRMGYTRDMLVGHGFRAMASTLLNEQGWPADAIEKQLAHGEKNKVRAAYNRAQYLPERKKMMQAWANYLDALKAGGQVTPIRQAK